MKIKRSLSVAAVVALMSVMTGGDASAKGAKKGRVVGMWFGTIYLTGVIDPAAPKVQFMAIYHGDGTFQLDSTSETGAHPLLPMPKSVFNGIWKTTGGVVKTKGFAFDEGAPGGFSILRGVTHLEFDGKDKDALVGVGDFDTLVCPGGPLDCPDPTEGPFLAIGDGVGPFPTVLRRFR